VKNTRWIQKAARSWTKLHKNAQITCSPPLSNKQLVQATAYVTATTVHICSQPLIWLQIPLCCSLDLDCLCVKKSALQGGAIGKLWDLWEVRPCGRSLDHWGCVLKGDSGTAAPSSFSLLLAHEVIFWFATCSACGANWSWSETSEIESQNLFLFIS
jgi:hypothetical protein